MRNYKLFKLFLMQGGYSINGGFLWVIINKYNVKLYQEQRECIKDALQEVIKQMQYQ